MKTNGTARKVSAIILCIACIAMLFCSCSKRGEEYVPALADCGIIHEPEFGGVYIKKTIDEFNELGFEYGDSVDVSFSNGYILEDIPYYNGYYTENGFPLLVAYPGYDYIKAAVNNGDDLWDIAGLPLTDSPDGNDTATVTLNERGKYLDIQNARDIHYEDDRDLFESDEVFANFRSVSAGSISANTLYRSASPCDNQHNRATYVNDLIEAAGVQCIVNLADNDEKIQGYLGREDFNCPYFLSLYENGKVILLALNTNYSSEEFRSKLATGLTAMAEQDGPYLVHCTEGKDRTGFVCMLLEALCGASYEEIEDDYMITYYNYYKITEENEKYDIIVEQVLDPMIRVIVTDGDISKADLSLYAADFLRSAGMSDTDISALRAKLTGISE